MKTVVLGASPNPARISHQACLLLSELDLPVIPIGIRKGKIAELDIEVGMPNIPDVHTISLYVGPSRQSEELINYMIALAPKRVIFNPGTEHFPTQRILKEKGIDVELACTLVMLRTNQYQQ